MWVIFLNINADGLFKGFHIFAAKKQTNNEIKQFTQVFILAKIHLFEIFRALLDFAYYDITTCVAL